MDCVRHDRVTTTGNAAEHPNHERTRGAVLWVPIVLFLIGAFAISYASGFRHVAIGWNGLGTICAVPLAAYLAAREFRIRFVQTILNVRLQNVIMAIAWFALLPATTARAYGCAFRMHCAPAGELE